MHLNRAMRKKLLFLLLIPLFNVSFAQNEFLTDSIFIRENKITKITNWQISPFDIYNKSKGTKAYERYYNENGQLEKLLYFDGEKANVEMDYTYNSKQHLISIRNIYITQKDTQLTTYTYNNKDELIQLELKRKNYPPLVQKFEYKNGLLIKKTTYSTNTNIDNFEVYTYKNNRIETVAYHYNAIDTPYLKLKLHYDLRGNEVWREILTKGRSQYYPKTYYTLDNKIERTESYSDNGKLQSKIEYTRKDGKVIKEDWYSYDEEKRHNETFYIYEGNLLKEVKSESNLSNNNSHSTYTYNKDSLLTVKTDYYGKNITYLTTYLYNLKKQLIEVQLKQPGNNPPSKKILYTYNSNGDTLERTTIDFESYSFRNRNYMIEQRYRSYGGIKETENRKPICNLKDVDTLIYSYITKEEHSIKSAKKSFDQHLVYGPLTRIGIDIDFAWEDNYYVPSYYLKIEDTLQNNIKDGKGELVLKLTVNTYGRSTANTTIKRTIYFTNQKNFTVKDLDSAGVCLLSLTVNDSNYSESSLKTKSIKNNTTLSTFNYENTYSPILINKTEYNDKGLILQKENFFNGGSEKSSYDYSKPSERKETRIYNSGLVFTTIVFYNNVGQKTKEVIYNNTGQIGANIEYIYKNKLLVETTSKMPEGSYMCKYEYN